MSPFWYSSKPYSMWLLVHSTTVTSPRTSFARRQTLASSQFDPRLTSNNNSGVNSFWSTQKQTPLTLWRGLRTINIRLANSKARIKPTAPLSVFDKENSMEFSLDFLHYLYNYYMVCALFSHAHHVTNHVTSLWHHVIWCLWLLVMWPWLCDYVTWHFPALPSV